MKTLQFFLTPAAGKALIGKMLARRRDIRDAMANHTLAIVAGTTNTYFADEALRSIGEEGILGNGFYRGIVKPASAKPALPMLEGDVIIQKGAWLRGKTISDIAPSLRGEDIIAKGANAVHLATGECGVLIGNPAYGTMAPVVEAVLGRGARLVIPVGVEKRVERPIHAVMSANNAASGLRLSGMPGAAYTELDAIADLGGGEAQIVASGGVCGYEGGCYYSCAVSGEGERALMDEIRAAQATPNFAV